MGVDRSFDFMTNNLHFTTLVSRRTETDGRVVSDRAISPLALGGLTDGVSPLEMAAAYVPFANGGTYRRPITFTLVTDMDGNEILRRETVSSRAMTEVTAFMMAQMLQGAVSNGTGGGAGVAGHFTAGKTGTTDNNHDRWFVGFTPHFVAAAWYGYDIPQNLGNIQNPCIAPFRNVMTEIHRNLPARTISRPAGVVAATTCMDSGLLPGDYCEIDIRGSRLQTSYFMAGRVPLETCELHVEHFICEVSEMRATPYCPPYAVRRVSVLRDRELEEETNMPCSEHDVFTIQPPDGTELEQGINIDIGTGTGSGTTTGAGTTTQRPPPPTTETIIID
jgi:penicillin-binding protein 1A